MKLFAYPFGEYNNAILEIVDALGYTGFGQQSGPLAPFSDPRVLPRFPFGGPYGDPQDFATKVNSLPMPLAVDAEPIRLESAAGEQLLDIFPQGSVARPVLVLQFEQGFDTGRVNCFISGQGRAPVRSEKTRVLVQAQDPLPAGRARYNCTARSDQAGRFSLVFHNPG